jgi:hypothetical protein
MQLQTILKQLPPDDCIAAKNQLTSADDRDGR